VGANCETKDNFFFAGYDTIFKINNEESSSSSSSGTGV
jgi:hypothetical protein